MNTRAMWRTSKMCWKISNVPNASSKPIRHHLPSTSPPHQMALHHATLTHQNWLSSVRLAKFVPNSQRNELCHANRQSAPNFADASNWTKTFSPIPSTRWRVWTNSRIFGSSIISTRMTHMPKRKWHHRDWVANVLEYSVHDRHIVRVRLDCRWPKSIVSKAKISIFMARIWSMERQCWMSSHTFHDTIIHSRVILVGPLALRNTLHITDFHSHNSSTECRSISTEDEDNSFDAREEPDGEENIASNSNILTAPMRPMPGTSQSNRNVRLSGTMSETIEHGLVKVPNWVMAEASLDVQFNDRATEQIAELQVNRVSNINQTSIESSTNWLIESHSFADKYRGSAKERSAFSLFTHTLRIANIHISIGRSDGHV